MKKTTFLKWDDGDVRWTPLLCIILVATIVCIATMGRHISFAMTTDFSSRGIWTVIGLVLSFAIAWRIDKEYSNNYNLTGLGSWIFVAMAIYFGAILGPVVGLKLDRMYSIPDEQVYYGNGKVINATDQSKKNFYFKTYKVSSEDSIYIVTYGEEPGYNWNWRSIIQANLGEKSNAPRADEDTWEKPLTNETLKIKDH